MKISFVGTGSGKTSLNQFHTSLLISSENYNLLVDAGDGISRALLSNKIGFNSIDGIVFTHLHPDHFSGFASLIVQMKMTNRDKPLDIFIHQSLRNVAKKFLVDSYIIPERIKFDIEFKTFLDNQLIKISKNFTFLAKKNSHLNKLLKYETIHPALSLYSASLYFEVDDKKIIYTSDIGSEDDLLLFKDLSSEIFICEANHLESKLLIKALSNIETNKIYLTHFPNDDLLMLTEILATTSREIQSKIHLAKDGLSFEI